MLAGKRTIEVNVVSGADRGFVEKIKLAESHEVHASTPRVILRSPN